MIVGSIDQFTALVLCFQIKVGGSWNKWKPGGFIRVQYRESYVGFCFHSKVRTLGYNKTARGLGTTELWPPKLLNHPCTNTSTISSLDGKENTKIKNE